MPRPADTSLLQRLRWSATRHQQRVDLPTSGNWMVLDFAGHRMALVRDETHEVIDLPSPRSADQPGAGAGYTRAGTATVADLACTEWRTIDTRGQETLACYTDDGVLLRATAGPRVLMQGHPRHLRRAGPRHLHPARRLHPPANQPLRSAMRRAVLLALLATRPALATTLHVIEHADTDATHSHGPDAAGDILTFHNPIYEATNTTRIGTDQGYCIRLVPGQAYECHWTLTLPHGQIMTDGPFYDTADSSMAVTGGTGRHAGARGELHLHARDAKGTAYDFTYDLQ